MLHFLHLVIETAHGKKTVYSVFFRVLPWPDGRRQVWHELTQAIRVRVPFT